jgi:hypothetical protein
MSEQIGAITCGSFSMTNAGSNLWVIECAKLPGWREEIKADRETAARLVTQLQADFRGTWEVQK